MSSHHPRAPLLLVRGIDGSVSQSEGRDVAACDKCGTRLIFSARERGDGLRGPCSRAANGQETAADRVRLAKVGPFGQAVQEATKLAHACELFRRFCLQGWLSMLLVQLRGEA